MENINNAKENFINKFNSLSDDRKADILAYNDIRQIDTLFREIKADAQSIIDYADRKCYGYGEVGYNLNELVKDFTEETPELEKEYKRLLNAYFNHLIEVNEA